MDEAAMYSLSALVSAAVSDAEYRSSARASGRALGPVTGLVQLDRALGGHLQAGVHVMHGAPGTGKTAFALQAAASCGCAALFVTCEMAPLVLLKRLAANVNDKYLSRFSSGEMPGHQAANLYAQAAQHAPNLVILDGTAGGLSAGRVLEAGQAAAALTDGRILVVVDSLHSYAELVASNLTEYEALNASLAGLRRVSAELAAPILLVTERNRASMDKGGLNAGAGTRRIEYGAESVIDLDVEKDARIDGQGYKPVGLTISKNRHGEAGMQIGLQFHGATQKFRE